MAPPSRELPTFEAVERLACGPWRRRLEALEYCKAGTWAEFPANVDLPRPGWLQFSERAAFRACCARAQSMCSGPIDQVMDLIPLWAGGLYDVDEPVDAWFRVHGSRTEEDALATVEIGPYFEDADPHIDCRLRCRVRSWQVGTVAASSSYAPGIELELRRGPYAVVESTITELIDFSRVEGHGMQARPELKVPPFASWFEPRVTNLDPALLRDIHALSFSLDEEGNAIDRPLVL